MRETIIAAIHKRMAVDQRLFFLTADVGINLVESIRDSYPDRFLNVGIAEANMIGIAAGLCNAGMRPIVYTISNFAVQRCFEQIRDDIALHDYQLVILGTTTGFDNCTLGPTHHVTDDWGTLRNVPNMEVHCPSSVAYAAWCIGDVLDREVAAYIRIPKGKGISSTVLGPWDYRPGGRQTLLVSYGGQAHAVIAAKEMHPDFSLLIVNQLRPLAPINSSSASHKRTVIVEDHFAETGLYSSFCQLAGYVLRSWLHSRAPDRYYREVGDTPEHFWKKYRGDAKSLVEDFRS